MTFDKALQAMRKGKGVYRHNKNGKSMYDSYTVKNNQIVHVTKKTPIASIAMVSLMASDWEVVK